MLKWKFSSWDLKTITKISAAPASSSNLRYVFVGKGFTVAYNVWEQNDHSRIKSLQNSL